MKTRILGLLLVSLLVGPSAANAVVLMQIQRISDTQAILTASGTLGAVVPDGDAHILTLLGPFGVFAPLSNSSVFDSSTMQVGDKPIVFAYDYTYGAEPLIFIGSLDGSFDANSAITGSLALNLQNGATWGGIGSSGNLLWGLFDTQPAGTWEIVGPSSVPEPASLALLGLGLAGFGLSRRRKKSGATRQLSAQEAA